MSHLPDRIWSLLAAALLLRFAMELWSSLPPGDPVHAITIIVSYLVGVMVIIFAVSEHEWLDRHRRKLAYACLLAFFLGTAALYFSRAWRAVYGTDALVYAQHSANVLLDGQNPYAVNMRPVAESQAGILNTTDATNGGIVDFHSYPAGSVLAFVPQAATGFGRWSMGFTPLVAMAASFGVLIHVVGEEWVFVPVVFLELPRPHLYIAAGGILDSLWILPVCVSMVALYYDRVWLAGAVFGLSMTMKQQPWLAAPFAMIFVAHHWDWRRSIAKFVAPAAGVFGAINLPFFVWGPTVWLDRVLMALGGFGPTQITQGAGLALLTVGQTYPLARWYYTMLMFGGLVVAVAIYYQHPAVFGWGAFVMTPLLLWLSSRSLNNYFQNIIPVAVLAALLASDAVRVPDWSGLPDNYTFGSDNQQT